MGLAEKDKLEIVDEAQSNTVQELTTLRNECGTLRNSLREAHGQLTVRQLQLDEISGERDGLRDAFDKSQAKLQTEDEESVEQLKKLLEDANSGANNASDDTGMASDFLERLAETTERSADNLAKRAEVSQQLLLSTEPFTVRSIFELPVRTFPCKPVLFSLEPNNPIKSRPSPNCLAYLHVFHDIQSFELQKD